MFMIPFRHHSPALSSTLAHHSFLMQFEGCRWISASSPRLNVVSIRLQLQPGAPPQKNLSGDSRTLTRCITSKTSHMAVRFTTTIIHHDRFATADFHASTEIRPFPTAPSRFLPGANDDVDEKPPPGTNFLANRQPSPRAFDATSFHSAGPNDAGFLAPTLQSQ